MAKRKFDSLNDVPQEILEKLKNYITNVGGSTFVIHGLPSEVTGAVLARYSRAPTGLQLTMINEFLNEHGDPDAVKGTELLDRVLNAFGDESVGELEGTHVGIEDISQLMTKEIEDRRIGGSPIEQSTRYVKYDVKDADGKWRYLRPREVIEAGLGEKFEAVNDRAFDTYSKNIPLLSDHFKKVFPRDSHSIMAVREGKLQKVFEANLENDNERREFNNSYNFTIRCAALDVGRALLPSSTLTHIGIYGNGRFFTNLLTHLKSSELAEPQQRASDLEHELNEVIPTFIKRNRAIPERATINRNMRTLVRPLFSSITPAEDKVTLVERADYKDEVVASCVFPYVEVSLQQILREVKQMPDEMKMQILDTYHGHRESRRDRTGRALEGGYPITFDLIGGFAEYRDLERHRMLLQMRQGLTTKFGFIVPEEFISLGIADEATEIAQQMADLNSDIRHAGLEEVSQYATLFNNRIRFMQGMNLREFQHLGELRTQPAGHFSYRAMVQEMSRTLQARDPWAQPFFEFVDYSDQGNKITRAAEQSRIAGKNLLANIDGAADYTQ